METVFGVWNFAFRKVKFLPQLRRKDGFGGLKMDFSDVCYECTGYGDDYSVNDDGELVCNCDECWVTMMERDGDYA